MPLREGYWFSTNSFKLIEVYEHLSFLSDLEGKVRTELGLDRQEKELAKELGMKTGAGWGLVRGEKPGERRERFLKTAMERGWVRIRQNTFEAWKLDSNTLGALVLAVKELGLPASLVIELHGISDHKAMSLTVAELLDYAAGERPAAVGFSIYENPDKSGRGVRGRERGARRTFDAGAVVAGGEFRTAATGRWNPLENPKLFGALMKMNPYEQRKYVMPEHGEGETVARIFMGLKVGTGKKAKTIKPEWVYNFVKEFRRKQLGSKLPGGASFIAQKGYFTHWQEAETVDEDSLQIIFYPDGVGGADHSEMDKNYKARGAVFAKHMHALAPALAQEFGQKAVILNLVVNGKLEFLGDYYRT